MRGHTKRDEDRGGRLLFARRLREDEKRLRDAERDFLSRVRKAIALRQASRRRLLRELME